MSSLKSPWNRCHKTPPPKFKNFRPAEVYIYIYIHLSHIYFFLLGDQNVKANFMVIPSETASPNIKHLDSWAPRGKLSSHVLTWVLCLDEGCEVKSFESRQLAKFITFLFAWFDILISIHKILRGNWVKIDFKYENSPPKTKTAHLEMNLRKGDSSWKPPLFSFYHGFLEISTLKSPYYSPGNHLT